MSTLLHYDVHDGAGEPILLLHGFLSSRGQWLANLEGIKEFATPVTVELFGHGRSPMPDNPAAMHPLAYIEQFEKIRHAIGAKRWYIVGQSFGAGLTLRYALEAPEVLYGQAFCNSNSALEQTDGSNKTERAKTISDVLLGGRPLTELPIHPVNAKRLPEVVKAALIEDAEMLQAEAMVRCLKETRVHLSVREKFASLTVPTLLINGVWEKSFQRTVNFARQELESLVVVDLEGGHAINAEQPDGFNDAIRAHYLSVL
jgi:pimeloyl-ACP methyl ester carboxylesterase